MAISEITVRASGHDLEPLAVSPREACRLLGIGSTRLYQLIGQGELQTYLDGRARRVVVASAHQYVERRLASAGATGAPTPLAPVRKRGRPRKHPVK
jgi:excisionase family DNA binding protein